MNIAVQSAMENPYTYTPYLWPMITIGFLVTLSVYSWRHRQIPGARPFAIALAFGVLWVAGMMMQLAAGDPAKTLFWMKFQVVWMLPVVTAMFCFVLEYAGLGDRLNRRMLTWLSMPPLLAAGLILTNDVHHLFWATSSVREGLFPSNGAGGWIFLVYAYLIYIVSLVIFIRLFIREPQKRWPIALILIGQVVTRVAFLLDTSNTSLLLPMGLTIPAFLVTNSLYALALFGFHMFDPIPFARRVAIKQMKEGMLVLDSQRVIIDLNPAAEKILGVSASQTRGQGISTIYPACPELSERLTDLEAGHSEISLEACQGDRFFTLHLSPLKDRHSRVVGYLLLMHDITEQKKAQAQLLEQQRVVATLQERERLARELHDNAGQVLAYVNLQAQAIHKHVQDGDSAQAQAQLVRLAGVAKQGHEDLRESIFNLKGDLNAPWSFLGALEQHLDAYRSHYGVNTELELPGGLDDNAFQPEEGVQLLRVIQEALTNAHRHGKARSVRISFVPQDGCVEIVVTDDGRGFDARRISTAPGDHFGMVFMQERMQQIGGSLSVVSHASAGTQVILTAPITNTS